MQLIDSRIWDLISLHAKMSFAPDVSKKCYTDLVFYGKFFAAKVAVFIKSLEDKNSIQSKLLLT